MGAAQYVYHQILSQSRVPAIYSACTGSHFTNDYIISLLNEKNIPFKQLEDEALFEYVADKIVNAGVVGWFNGRAEFGPRALGARSILANPGRADAKDLINSKIKRRESFRPFAPSILKEYVGDYFESTDLAPFMERVYPIKEDKRASIPAVTHADGSGRLQTVDKIISPRYYQLIDAFRRRSGIPILLNTSFNENEPIVNKPEEALDCFLRTDMDMLVMENIIVER
jgi:carbamoyltransferase